MASIIKNGWNINFINEQDLTSNYMNKLLMGCLHPGIYNANIAVSFNTDENNKTELEIHFKKGTTLLFSNDYIGGNDSSTPCERNFKNISLSSSINEKDGVLIKYVAEFDCTLNESIQFKEDEYYSKDLFLFLKIDSKIDESSQEPKLYIAKINDNTTDSIYGSYTYKIIGDRTGDSAYFIPDGCINYKNTGTRQLEDYCFLCIGVIRDLDTSKRLTNFTFTTQGLPEYSYSLIATSNCEYSSLVFCRKSESDDTLGLYGANLRNILIKNTFCNEFGFNTEGIVSEKDSWLRAFDGSITKSLLPIDIKNGWNAIYGYINENKINYGSVSFNDFINFNNTIIAPDTNSLATDWGVNNIVPLDSCEYNVNNLLSCIKNIDIWSYVIEVLHKSADANNINTIFPVAIAYKNDEENFINPNNVLSYFDLYYRSSSVSIYNGSMSNIFHVIPVLSDEDSTSDTTTE